MRLARVTRLYPDSADVVYLDDGWHAPQVPILRETMSSNAGTFDQPTPDPVDDELKLSNTAGRVTLAVIGFIKGFPIITGFLTPASSEMIFAEENRYVKRFPSDVVVTSDDVGNVELYHPSGTFLRIGETPEHDDLTGKDINGKFKLRRNLDRQVHLQLIVANGGEEKGRFGIDPDGNAVLRVKGALDAQSDGEAAIVAPVIRLTGDLIHTGNFQSTGGTFTHNGVNVGGTHVHTSATPGSPTSTPV